MYKSNSFLSKLWLIIKKWFTPLRIVITCIMLAIALVVVGIFVVRRLPIHTFRLTPEQCVTLVGFTPDEIEDVGVDNCEDVYLLFDRVDRVDYHGNLVVKLSQVDIEATKYYADWYLDGCASEGVLRKGDYSQISMELTSKTKDSDFLVMWNAESMCLIMQLMNGTDPEDNNVKCVIWHKSPGNVVYSFDSHDIIGLIEESIFDTGGMIPYMEYLITEDYCMDAFGLTIAEFCEQDVIRRSTIDRNGDVNFKISILDWKKWYDEAEIVIAEAAAKGIKVSEDRTEITVSYSNDTSAENDEIIRLVKQKCCLLQLLDGKDIKDIKVTLTVKDSETSDTIYTQKWSYD